MELRTDICEKEAVQRLRAAVDYLAEANRMIQKVYESSDSLYEIHNTLEDLAANLEAEADELESIA